MDESTRIQGEQYRVEELTATPYLLFGSLASLEQLRALVKCGDAEIQNIITNGDRALAGPDETVTEKTQLPASGDIHDYLSLAPFWWPNPSTSDGLPYIRMDGVVNPATRGVHTDFLRRGLMLERVESLATAFYVTRDVKYSIKAQSLLRTWFLDASTKMNPNLNHGQAIPGNEDGRVFGIIEWAGIDQLLDAISILRASDGIPADVDGPLVQWFQEYTTWLMNSSLGQLATTRKNNHATFYDVQLASLLLFLGRSEEARQVLEAVKSTRIATQIEPDGKQPEEVKRSRSLQYSVLNLTGLQKLAHLGHRVDVDLESFETSDGRSIRKAHEFIRPYIENEEDWPL